MLHESLNIERGFDEIELNAITILKKVIILFRKIFVSFR